MQKNNYLYGRAHSKFVESGAPKKGYEANFYYGWDSYWTFNNMQDYKSRSSFYYHAPVQNYKRGQGYIGNNGMWYPPIQGENNTYQTYIFMTDK